MIDSDIINTTTQWIKNSLVPSARAQLVHLLNQNSPNQVLPLHATPNASLSSDFYCILAVKIIHHLQFTLKFKQCNLLLVELLYLLVNSSEGIQVANCIFQNKNVHLQSLKDILKLSVKKFRAQILLIVACTLKLSESHIGIKEYLISINYYRSLWIVIKRCEQNDSELYLLCVSALLNFLRDYSFWEVFELFVSPEDDSNENKLLSSITNTEIHPNDEVPLPADVIQTTSIYPSAIAIATDSDNESQLRTTRKTFHPHLTPTSPTTMSSHPTNHTEYITTPPSILDCLTPEECILHMLQQPPSKSRCARAVVLLCILLYKDSYSKSIDQSNDTDQSTKPYQHGIFKIDPKNEKWQKTFIFELKNILLGDYDHSLIQLQYEVMLLLALLINHPVFGNTGIQCSIMLAWMKCPLLSHEDSPGIDSSSLELLHSQFQDEPMVSYPPPPSNVHLTPECLQELSCYFLTEVIFQSLAQSLPNLNPYQASSSPDNPPNHFFTTSTHSPSLISQMFHFERTIMTTAPIVLDPNLPSSHDQSRQFLNSILPLTKAGVFEDKLSKLRNQNVHLILIFFILSLIPFHELWEDHTVQPVETDKALDESTPLPEVQSFRPFDNAASCLDESMEPTATTTNTTESGWNWHVIEKYLEGAFLLDSKLKRFQKKQALLSCFEVLQLWLDSDSELLWIMTQLFHTFDLPFTSHPVGLSIHVIETFYQLEQRFHQDISNLQSIRNTPTNFKHRYAQLLLHLGTELQINQQVDLMHQSIGLRNLTFKKRQVDHTPTPSHPHETRPNIPPPHHLSKGRNLSTALHIKTGRKNSTFEKLSSRLASYSGDSNYSQSLNNSLYGVSGELSSTHPRQNRMQSVYNELVAVENRTGAFYNQFHYRSIMDALVSVIAYEKGSAATATTAMVTHHDTVSRDLGSSSHAHSLGVALAQSNHLIEKLNHQMQVYQNQQTKLKNDLAHEKQRLASEIFKHTETFEVVEPKDRKGSNSEDDLKIGNYEKKHYSLSLRSDRIHMAALKNAVSPRPAMSEDRFQSHAVTITTATEEPKIESTSRPKTANSSLSRPQKTLQNRSKTIQNKPIRKPSTLSATTQHSLRKDSMVSGEEASRVFTTTASVASFMPKPRALHPFSNLPQLNNGSSSSGGKGHSSSHEKTGSMQDPLLFNKQGNQAFSHPLFGFKYHTGFRSRRRSSLHSVQSSISTLDDSGDRVEDTATTTRTYPTHDRIEEIDEGEDDMIHTDPSVIHRHGKSHHYSSLDSTPRGKGITMLSTSRRGSSADTQYQYLAEKIMSSSLYQNVVLRPRDEIVPEKTPDDEVPLRSSVGMEKAITMEELKMKSLQALRRRDSLKVPPSGIVLTKKIPHQTMGRDKNAVRMNRLKAQKDNVLQSQRDGSNDDGGILIEWMLNLVMTDGPRVTHDKLLDLQSIHEDEESMQDQDDDQVDEEGVVMNTTPFTFPSLPVGRTSGEEGDAGVQHSKRNRLSMVREEESSGHDVHSSSVSSSFDEESQSMETMDESQSSSIELIPSSTHLEEAAVVSMEPHPPSSPLPSGVRSRRVIAPMKGSGPHSPIDIQMLSSRVMIPGTESTPPVQIPTNTTVPMKPSDGSNQQQRNEYAAYLWLNGISLNALEALANSAGLFESKR